MIARKDNDHGIAIEQLGAESAVEGRFERPGESHVDLAGSQCFHLLGRSHLVERELDVGVKLAVIANDARKKTSRTPQKKADAERAYLAEKRTVCDFDGPVGCKEGLTCFSEKELAMRSESSTA